MALKLSNIKDTCRIKTVQITRVFTKKSLDKAFPICVLPLLVLAGLLS